MATNGNLRANQKRAITALLTADSIEAAAAAANVGERTLHRWLNEDAEFQAALRAEQGRAIDAAISRLTGAAMSAANVLVTIAEDETENSRTRVSAARAILGNMMKLVEIRELEQRLSDLEQRINGNYS